MRLARDATLGWKELGVPRGDSRKRRGVEPTAMDEDDDYVNVNGLSQEFERELAVGRAPKRACSHVDVRDAGR